MAVVAFLLPLLGRLLAWLPEGVMRALARGLGDLIWYLPNRRQRIQQANLRLAFPDRDEAWYARIGRLNFHRLIEYGLFILASPAMPEARLRRYVRINPKVEKLAESFAGQNIIIFVPHVTLLEALPFLSRLLPQNPIAAIFRPLRNATLSKAVLDPRRRWGMHLIGRKGGLLEAAHFLGRGGWLAIPADQNTGAGGTLVLFFDRPCSATPLPEQFLQQYGGTFVGLIVRRTGFLSGEIDAEIIPTGSEKGDITIAGHEWLERTLRADENQIVDWFWSHRRWRVLHDPRTCFQLHHRKVAVPRQLERRGLTAWPRHTRVVVIPPADPAAGPTLWPLLERLREARPDFELTIWQSAAAPDRAAVPPTAADRVVALPLHDRRDAAWTTETRRVPEYVIRLDADGAWDQPVRRLHASHVFAPEAPGRRRPLGSQIAPVDAALPPAAWLEPFFLHFGLPPV